MQVAVAQIQEWHEEGIRLAAGYLRDEARMVELLSFMSGVNGFFYYQSESLQSYAISQWKLPENAAREMVTVARKAVEIPALLTALKRRKTSVSKLRRICAVITIEDQAEWLDVAERCSFHEILKLIATARPEKAIQEGFFYRAENLLEMRAAVTEEVSQEILRIQDLLSQKLGRPATLGEALKQMTKLTLEKLDSVKKAERAEKRAAVREKRGALRMSKQPRRIGHRANLVHALNLRDQAQCTHIDPNGQRCPNRRWLHFHHIQPRSQGGKDTLENLTTLCSQHHRLVHHQLSLEYHH